MHLPESRTLWVGFVFQAVLVLLYNLVVMIKKLVNM